MAGSTIRFELDRFHRDGNGYRAIMKGQGVQDMLAAKAARVAGAVESQLDLEDWTVVHDVQIGKTRAGAMISGVPMSIEERDGVLGSAIDAAR